MKISGTHLYEFTNCPHQIYLEISGDHSLKEKKNEFVEMLEQQGVLVENEVISKLPISVNLKSLDNSDRVLATIAAMKRGEPLIYGGRLISDQFAIEPDLLKKTPAGYKPVDIKSGAATEGEDDKFKLAYAMQLAHYVHFLEREGYSDNSRSGEIIDADLNATEILLSQNRGVRLSETWWEKYHHCLATIQGYTSHAIACRPALSSACKLCQWKSFCKKQLVESNDLTLIPELGRAQRDSIQSYFPTLNALATGNIQPCIIGKKTIFNRVGPDTLEKYQKRAILLTTPGATPYAKEKIVLPQNKKEIFWDIEDNPMDKFVYLHGFVERATNCPDTAKFIPQFSAENEEEAFAAAFQYLADNVEHATIYHYSAYEKTTYRKLAEKYPDVCNPERMAELLGHPNIVDLYGIVKKNTEWPCYDHSIKTLAVYLGFKWRDQNPSGAASIAWFIDYKSSGSAEIKKRILDYNEDDCIATGIVLDGIVKLPIR